MGSEDGQDFLVMECLEGETLAERLRRGRLPLDDVLRWVIEIGDALAAAHAHGIVHRDLKPSNIMLTKSGAKLLDFGLAQVRQQLAVSANTVTAQPLTTAGAILGTAPYMAPEQVQGHPVDARSDIFAFGVVLYEMLAGHRPFAGDTAIAVAGAILTREPESLVAARPAISPALNHLVAVCLAKDPDQRWQSITDVIHQLRWLASSVSDSTVLPTSRRRFSRQSALWAIAGLTTGSAIVALLRGPTLELPSSRAASAFEIRPQQGEQITGAPAISADGTRIVYAAVGPDGISRLHLCVVDDVNIRTLMDTDSAVYPFFSPDGESVGFFAEGALRSVSLASGAVSTVVPDLPAQPGIARGASWGADGTIVFSRGAWAGIERVPSRGGEVVQLTTPPADRGEVAHMWPTPLPGGRAVLFTTTIENAQEPFKVCIWTEGRTAHRDLIDGARHARYLEPGQLIFARGSSLLVVPFDLTSLQVTGAPILVMENVRGLRGVGLSQFAVSSTGTLVYADELDRQPESTPTRVARDGVEAPLTNARGVPIACTASEGHRSYRPLPAPVRPVRHRQLLSVQSSW